MSTVQGKILKNTLTLSRVLFGNNFMPKTVGRNILNSYANIIPPPKNCSIEQIKFRDYSCFWVRDKREIRDRIIFYLHGGGFHIGSMATHKRLVYRLCSLSKTKGFFVDYRLAPEFKFPSPIEDSVNAYRYLINQGYSSKNIIFCGDSAGAGLALSTSILLKEEGLPLPQAIVCMSPWVDLELTGNSIRIKDKLDPWLDLSTAKNWAKSYLNGTHPRNYLASPIYADLTGLPPILIHVGSNEILLSDSERLYKRALEFGVKVEMKVWAEMIHVFQAFDRVFPESSKSIKEIGKFMQNQFRK